VVIKVGSPTRAREAGSSSYNSPKAAEKLLQCISDGNEVGPRSESAETSLQYHLAKSLVVKLLGARHFSRKHSEAATPWVDIKPRDLISIPGRKKSGWPSGKGAIGVGHSLYPLIQSFPPVLFVSVARLVHHILYPILLFMGSQYPGHSSPLSGCSPPRYVFGPYAREESDEKTRAETRVRRIGHEAREVKGSRICTVLRRA
jgi:hypothetical protein